MIAAINFNQNWSNLLIQVFTSMKNLTLLLLRLHGNKIAEVTDDSMTIFDGGWQTSYNQI